MGEAGLFDLTFEPAPGAILNRESQITPLVESLADVQGNYMTSRAQGSGVRVVAGADTGTVVYVGAPDQSTPFTVTVGMTTTVTVWITPVTGLGSGTFELAFNPAVVRALACHPYATTGGDGSGLCAVHADHVRANLLSYAGLDGPVLAFEGIFTAADGARPGDSSDLSISVETLMDINGAPIPAATVSNTLIIDPGSGPGSRCCASRRANRSYTGTRRPPCTCSWTQGRRCAPPHGAYITTLPCWWRKPASSPLASPMPCVMQPGNRERFA